MPSLDFEVERTAFRSYYQENSLLFEQGKNALLTLLKSLVTDAGRSAAAFDGRVKDCEESIRKFTRKYQTALERDSIPYTIQDQITDLIGLRLVCLYEDEVEPIGALVKQHFEIIDETDKSAQLEGTENEFGYKGLHLDLRLAPDRASMPEYRQYAPLRFELQIRTIIQDSWSTLDHKIKYKKSIPAPLKRRINTLAALFELADREFRQVRDETQIEINKAEAEEVDAGEGEGATQGLPQESDIERGQFAPLNAFRLLRIANHFFPGLEFDPRKIDGFTAEVIGCEPTISRGKFNHYLRSTITFVRRYRTEFLAEGRSATFTPFTEMRHCLYVAAPQLFAGMLTAYSRASFDEWRARQADDTSQQSDKIGVELGTVRSLTAAAPAHSGARGRRPRPGA